MHQAISVALLLASQFIFGFTMQSPHGSRRLHPLTVINYCVTNAIPCGLEVMAVDAPPEKFAVRSDELSELAPMTVASVVNAFNERHANYQAKMMDGVVVIRPTRPSVYIDSNPGLGRIDGRGLMWLAGMVFLPLDPSLARRPTVGSVLSRPGDVADRGGDIEMAVDGSGRTVLNILNDIVKRAPTHAWLVRTSKEKILSFGFVNGDGTVMERAVLY